MAPERERWRYGTAILVSAVTSISCSLLLTSYLNRGTADTAQTPDQRIHQTLREHSRQLSEFEPQLSAMPRLISSATPMQDTAAGPDEIHELQDRIETLEEDISRLTRNLQHYGSNTGLGESAAARPYRLAESRSTAYRGNTFAEEIYASDAGKPLDHYSEKIPHALHAMEEHIAVQDIHCKTSVCRVAFSRRGDDKDNSDVVERLSTALGDADLDIRHARDEMGNSVMYIQLH